MNSNASSSTPEDLPIDSIPRHVAIIMDGNGRWAKKRLLNRIKGHEKGADTVRVIIRSSRELGVSMLTLYAFSTENWQRSDMEIRALMILLKRFLQSETAEMLENGIRLNVIGQMHRLPTDVQEALQESMDKTRDNSHMMLNLALSYGSRTEIAEAMGEIGHLIQAGRINPDEIDIDLIADHLYTRGMPDPDLLIRTSGEIRISNFLLWQIAYTEIFITDTLWPDFTREEYVQILKSFHKRERRFGKVGV